MEIDINAPHMTEEEELEELNELNDRAGCCSLLVMFFIGVLIAMLVLITISKFIH